MQSVLGEAVTASISVDAYGGLGSFGARIEVPITRAIASAWHAATLIDTDYFVTLESPVAAGDYQLVWMDDMGTYQTMVPLTVVVGSVGGEDWDPVDLDDIRPTVEDVAALERTRTITTGGADTGEFNETTHPTADEVEGVIDTAVGLVMDQLPTDRFDPKHYMSVTSAIKLQAAIIVESSYFRERLDQGSADLYSRSLQSAIISLNNKITADSRIGSGIASGRPALRIE